MRTASTADSGRDVDFNANVVTHSDGRLLHGIGGRQNCLFGRCTILPIPSFGDRTPVLVDRVTTLCGPGELVDVIATECGIAINQRRADLLARLRGSSLPRPPTMLDRVMAAIKWVDGTVIDSVWQLKEIVWPALGGGGE